MYLPYKILSDYKNIEDNLKLSFNFSGEIYDLISVEANDNNVELLSKWREEFWDAFPAKFKVTLEGTKKWLVDQVINNEDRILFMIVKGTEVIGHLGLFRFDKEENACEIDNVVKGVNGYPGIMTLAMKALINFSFNDLKLNRLYLRVFSDNQKAKRLYERCGFKEIELIPLKKNGTENEYAWNEIPDEKQAERFFSKMVLEGKDYD